MRQSDLVLDILREDNDLRRMNHLLKVTAYAAVIGEQEDLPEEQYEILVTAALLHDVGIRTSLEQYGSAAGEYQQIEGPPIARRILEARKAPSALIDRVCCLISRHHVYTGIDGMDCQILVEADFLVNIDEGGMGREEVRRVRENIFRTAAGTQLLNRLFRPDDE